MKMRKLVLAAGLTAVMIMAGCGRDAAKEEAPEQQTEQTEDAAVTDETETTEADDSTEQAADAEDSQGDGQTENGEEATVYEDNFAVDSEAAAAFGSQIKEAVAAKDLEALAELTAFPVYVGIPDTDGMVETKEDFLALGADQVITQELMDSVAAADETALEPSMAGFVLSNESGRPNIIFGVVEGSLAVTGINY